MNGALTAKSPLCLVTGANTGIGFEIARGLARSGDRVILACRDLTKGEAARQAISSECGDRTVELLIVDLSALQSIHATVRLFSSAHTSLDVLVNNAGISSPTRQERSDGIEL